MNKKYLPSALILYLNYFIHGVGCSILGQAVIKEALAAAWGVEAMAITAISAALGLGRLIALPFAGPLSDKLGRRISTAIGSASYAIYLTDAIKDSGLPREEFKLKVGAFGAEPWTENMRHEIEEKLGIKAYDIYGLSEIAGPGVGYECECQHGTHLNEDHYFPEIIDPNTLQPVEPGQTGELVFTHLTKEGMPLLRYRTRDLTALHHDKCSCGRTLVRMDRILGRSDDMLIIRGVNVFPTQIESVILEMEEFEPHYLLIVGRENNTDTMELQVEVRPEFYSDEINKMLALKKKLGGRLQSVLGLGVNVKLVEPRSIERSVGKAKRVIDNRKI